MHHMILAWHQSSWSHRMCDTLKRKGWRINHWSKNEPACCNLLDSLWWICRWSKWHNMQFVLSEVPFRTILEGSSTLHTFLIRKSNFPVTEQYNISCDFPRAMLSFNGYEKSWLHYETINAIMLKSVLDAYFYTACHPCSTSEHIPHMQRQALSTFHRLHHNLKSVKAVKQAVGSRIALWVFLGTCTDWHAAVRKVWH